MSEPIEYETLVTRMTIVPAGEPFYHERAWTIEIEDESGGEFLIVRSHSDTPTEIRIDADEWPALRAAIDAMAARCRG